MKKLLTVLLVLAMALGLTACGKKEEEKDPEWYGTWVITKLQMEGFTEDVMEQTLKYMKDNNQVFYMEFGKTSYIYNPDGKGGYTKIEIQADFEKHKLIDSTNPEGMDFEYKDNKIYILEPQSGVTFILEKGNAQ